MRLGITFLRARRAAVLAASMAAALAPAQLCKAAPSIPTPAVATSGRWREASLEDYRKHLLLLATVVEACAKARDLKNCDPMLVGPDDRVPLGSSANAPRRLVRYGWLRVLFSKAEEPDQPTAQPDSGSHNGSRSAVAQSAQPTTSQLLVAAEIRLASDFAQADGAVVPMPAYSQQRGVMLQVLGGRDFRNVVQPSVRDAILEKVGNWLNKLYEDAARLRAQSVWVGRAIVVGFILVVCVGLVWGLMQLERRWRVRLVPESHAPAVAGPSARDWQLWLEDARRAADSGLWREAIHFVYWAAISRLESRRLWPADRARTPREYLALVDPQDPRKSGLARLTSSFERTWYGGRPAEERDYRNAERFVQALIAGGEVVGSAQGGAR